MKYVLCALVGVGLSASILLVSFWRQGQVTMFPQISSVVPTPAPNAMRTTLPPELTEYTVPYNPKILPLTPLYLPKMVWQRLELAFPRSRDDKQHLLLDRAEERMSIALYVWQKNLPQNADANVVRSQQYLLKAAQVDASQESSRLRQIQIQHASILESLEAHLDLTSEAMALNQLVQSLIVQP